MKKIAKLISVFVLAFAIAFSAVPLLSGEGTASAATKTPGKVYSLKVAKSSSSTRSYVKLTWKKASYAKKYYVYRKAYSPKTGKYGSWSYVKSVTATSKSTQTTKTTQPRGVTYCYKVCAVNGTKKGTYSTITDSCKYKFTVSQYAKWKSSCYVEQFGDRFATKRSIIEYDTSDPDAIWYIYKGTSTDAKNYISFLYNKGKSSKIAKATEELPIEIADGKVSTAWVVYYGDDHNRGVAATSLKVDGVNYVQVVLMNNITE